MTDTTTVADYNAIAVKGAFKIDKATKNASLLTPTPVFTIKVLMLLIEQLHASTQALKGAVAALQADAATKLYTGSVALILLVTNWQLDFIW